MKSQFLVASQKQLYKICVFPFREQPVAFPLTWGPISFQTTPDPLQNKNSENFFEKESSPLDIYLWIPTNQRREMSEERGWRETRGVTPKLPWEDGDEKDRKRQGTGMTEQSFRDTRLSRALEGSRIALDPVVEIK